MKRNSTDRRQEVTQSRPLFRKAAARAAGQRVFGQVTAVLPPSAPAGLLLALLTLGTIGLAGWLVEVPQKSRAVGVLMPRDGFVDIVADAPGTVVRIAAGEGESVVQGEPLVDLATGRPLLTGAGLDSLQRQLAVQREIERAIVYEEQARTRALDAQAEALDQQFDGAARERSLQAQRVDLLERRLERRRGLAVAGNLPPDTLEAEQAALLQAQSAVAALERAAAGYRQQLATIRYAGAEARDVALNRRLSGAREQHRLERAIDERRFELSRTLEAPVPGVVARVFARRGASVTAGELLVRMHRPHGELEAWMYLPSARAGFLRPGQSVRLRLDAYPFELFGTRDAIVTSVSAIAMVPREIDVPVPLAGPVFEVRARLAEEHISALDTVWALAPGTSFTADVVRRRFTLWQWLLRAVTRDSHG